MRYWSERTVVADGQAFATEVLNGRATYYLSATDAAATTVTAMAQDRLGGIGAGETVLVVPNTDESLRPWGDLGGDTWWEGNTPAHFSSVLTLADGTGILLSGNQADYRGEEGEPSDYAEPYIERTATFDFHTAYQLGGSPAYADYRYLATGHDVQEDFEQLFWVEWEEDGEYYGDYLSEDWHISTHEVVDAADPMAFDSAAYLYTYRLDHDRVGTYVRDYGSSIPINDHSSTLYAQVVLPGGGSQPAAVVLDTSPVGTGVLIERAGGQLGVLWINAASVSALALSLAALRPDGTVARTFNTAIDLGALSGAPTLVAATSATNKDIFAVVEIGNVPYLVQFDAGLHQQGELTRIAGGRWTGSSAEHLGDVSLVALPDGGVLLAFGVDGDGVSGGDDHRIVLQQLDADGHRVGATLKITDADGGWFDLDALGDGRVQLTWTDDGQTLSRVLDTAAGPLVTDGTADNDVIIGTAYGDTLAGGAGKDQIDGGAGNDRISGGDGNDILIGGAGADRIDGGAGRDLLRYDNAVTVDLLDASLNTGDAAGDVITSIEQFRGSHLGDAFHGSDGADVFDGMAGDDILVGRAGDDLLIGNAGDDTMTGGGGRDEFRYAAFGDGVDRITDFTRGEDVISIRATVVGETFYVIANDAPRPNRDAPTFLFDTDSKTLSYDADGRGAIAAIEIAVLDGVETLAKADFLLIA
ncbi:calcium-binding protein [Zavarzinia aquatilis]|uniref:Uncharacterized protein n=1 Tax=Zavarzinia aquatilis TaxID=2211142 RepID=A0A317E2T1_9PROT|nr:calcium-binding protein [Zavarzinia aquatilis]PWR19415.1 hypothetical protein DKG74_16600 [Zavarzinia aquatilis]